MEQDGKIRYLSRREMLGLMGSTAVEFTSQLYFDDALTDEVHSEGPYAEKGQRDQRNSDDGIFQGGGDELTLALTENREGYAATFDIALDTTYA